MLMCKIEFYNEQWKHSEFVYKGKELLFRKQIHGTNEKIAQFFIS